MTPYNWTLKTGRSITKTINPPAHLKTVRHVFKLSKLISRFSLSYFLKTGHVTDPLELLAGKTILARDKGKGGSSLQLPSTGSHISVSDSLLFLIICRLRPEGLSTHKKTGHNHHRPSSYVIREQPPCLPSFSRKIKTKIWEFALSEKLKWMEAYYGQFSPNMGWRNVDQSHVNPFKYPEEERRSRGEAVPL